MATVLAVVTTLVAMATLATAGSVVNIDGTTLINMTLPGGPTLGKTMVTTPNTFGANVVDAVVDVIGESCIFPEDYLFLRRLALLESDDGQDPKTYNHVNNNGGIWQVTEAMFKATQANTPNLHGLYTGIREAFGIEWLAVSWSDLRKPLYSGLAASLFVFLQSKGRVPTSAQQQGSFAHNSYNQLDTAFNFTRVAQHMQVSCDQDQRIDVAFLLDASVSSEDFRRMRSFVQDVIDLPFAMSSGNIRAAVFQLTSSGTVSSTGLTSDQKRFISVLNTLPQAHSTQSVDVPAAVSGVAHYAFASSTRSLSARMIVVITDKGDSGTEQEAIFAGQDAVKQGVSVMVIGVGETAAASRYLQEQATAPKCRHHVAIDSFHNLTDLKHLTQRTICREPMIAQGMVHCNITDCRNIAFPVLSRATTLMINMSCDDATAYVTTRTAKPEESFYDFKGKVVAADGVRYVAVDDDVHKFIYADVFGINPVYPNCVATLAAFNGIRHQGPQTPAQACKEWEYPTVNPCTSSSSERHPYDRDPGMFIVCDLRNHPYLTKCPPGEPYYSPECEMCVGGPNSPAISGCKTNVVTQDPDVPYCGLPKNPCTKASILQGHYFFACPLDEKKFLQCNIWGHFFVKSCPQNQVWRQHALTCEFENTGYVSCDVPGKRFYPYPADAHYYIDCGIDMVPVVRPCPSYTTYNDTTQSCSDYGFPQSTARPITTYPPITFQHFTLPPVTTRPPVSYGTPDPITNKISSGYAYPCTHQNIEADRLYFPYPGDPNEYIQCDLWGDAFRKYCQPGFTFNGNSHTCVGSFNSIVG